MELEKTIALPEAGKIMMSTCVDYLIACSFALLIKEYVSTVAKSIILFVNCVFWVSNWNDEKKKNLIVNDD